MRSAAGTRSALSVVGLLLMIGGLVGLFGRHALLSPARPVIFLQVVAVVTLIWARLTFGPRSFHASATPTDGGLVTTGPYRYIRHPIYASVCLFAWASVLGHLSGFSIAMALLVSAGAGIRMALEEVLLVQRYPDYRAYVSTTKRVVPFLF